jgi:hypothetical protein
MKPHPNQLRNPPADLAQMAANMTVTELSRHYVCGDSTLKRWIRETGVCPVPRAVLVTPPDFTARAKSMHQMGLVRHYGVSQQTVERWARKANIQFVPYVPPRKERQEKPRPTRAPAAFVWKGQRVPRVPPRDSSMHGSAAEHLRRYAAVYRCSERGGADPTGEFYRYGNTVLNPDELLMRAQRHGWEAVA